jgi:uncharacterized protein (TIGR01244 family)
MGSGAALDGVTAVLGAGMVPVALSYAVAVGEIPTAEQIKILAEAGFQSILNAQPDGEVDRLLSASEAGAIARGHNLEYRHIPIESRRPSEMQINAYAAALSELPKPIYACCYSGSRAAAAWALAAAPHVATDEIVKSVADAGYDVNFLRPALDQRHEAAAAPVVAAADALALPPDAPVSPDSTALPSLMPKVIFPVAASAGGYAIAG